MKKNRTKLNLLQGIIISFLFTINACQPMEQEEILQFTTENIEYVSEGTYSVYGFIATLGKENISQHGICWSESEHPGMEESSIQLGPCNAAGGFICVISGLSQNTTYHIRAFVVVNSTPLYANEKTIMTEQSLDNMLVDVDGNIYRTIVIGDQTWMAENLKVTRYADETPIPWVKDQPSWFDFTRESKGYCWYDNVVANGFNYGALYSWPAAVRRTDGSDLVPSGVQGVCPDGWHLPSDGEWKQLELNMGMSQDQVDQVDWRGTVQGGKLKSPGTRYWKSSNSESTGEARFDALPAGYRHGYGNFSGVGTTTRFWSTTNRGYGYVWHRQLDHDNASVHRDFSPVYRGYSVRCVKDN